MSYCCSLPCEDSVCRDDMDHEGGCEGADLADKINKILT